MWEAGAGTPVICIHGFMGTACDWRFNVEELGKHFAVSAFDLPGFGYTDKPLNFDYTSKGYASFVKDFMDARKIGKAVLVGNSLGGQIAIKTCLEYADRVSALILIDSGGYPGSVRFPLFRLLKVSLLGPAIMSLVTRSSTRYILCQVLKNRSAVSNEVVTYYCNVYKTANARKIPALVVKNVTKDETELHAGFNQIKCPTLIIWGTLDNVIPPRYGPLFRDEIAGSKLLTVEQAGHMPQIDSPAIVNQAIINFISSSI